MSVTSQIFRFSILILTLVSCSYTQAQDILLDHPIRCGQLQCFPSAQDSNVYYYLPSNPHVALNEENKHEFSFTRYVKTQTSDSGEGGIVDADGGGIVHFLVDYTVSDKQLARAIESLQEDNDEASLRGPVIFESGSFALVSSFAKDEDKPNELTKQVIGVGRAPLIEGLKAAVSMHLTKQGSQLLWRSFQMDTPDISLVFEMTFSGLNDPANAVITADWKKLQDMADVSIGGDIGYMGIGVGFDYSNFWQSANDSGAITIDYKGDPDKLDAIIDRTYTKLHEMMFEPIEVIDPSADENDPLAGLSALADTLGSSGAANYNAPWEVKINGGYKRRKLTHKGLYTFTFNQQSKGTLTTAMAGNIGSLYRIYGDDPGVFRTINLSDNEYKTREISVSLDAKDEKEFTKYINYVNVTIKKSHGSGNETVAETVIKRSNYAQGRPQVLSYNWEDESDVESWMQYDYKIDWSFIGGAQHSSGWQSGNSAAIALTPPYQYREFKFVASPNIVSDQKIRNITVRVAHDFFGTRKTDVFSLGPVDERYKEEKIFAVPPGTEMIDYTITWRMQDKTVLSSGKQTTDEAVIFCDELPN